MAACGENMAAIWFVSSIEFGLGCARDATGSRPRTRISSGRDPCPGGGAITLADVCKLTLGVGQTRDNPLSPRP
jgi:hypothetical protein